MIEASDMRAFPPRRPDQPIFYPVLIGEYSAKIARDWNVPAPGAGFVTRFTVRRSYLDSYRIEEAGGRAAIVGKIEVIARFPTDAVAQSTDRP